MVIPIGTGRSESFLIKEEKTVLVDTGASSEIETFLELLAKHDTTLDDLSLIIITHGHIDHFVLLPELKKSLRKVYSFGCHTFFNAHARSYSAEQVGRLISSS